MGILVINLCLLTVTWLSMWSTYRQEASPEVRSLYRCVIAAGAIYFLALPVIHMLAEIISGFVVRKYIERAEICARFISTVFLILCFRPARVEIAACLTFIQADAELLGKDSGVTNRMLF